MPNFMMWIVLTTNLVALPAWAGASRCFQVYLSPASRAMMSPVKIKDGRVLKIQQNFPASAGPKIVSLDIAENAGAVPVEMLVQLPSGGRFNLLGRSTPQSIQAKYEAKLQQGDPYAGNVFFQPGAAGALVGLANRLTGEMVAPGVMEASILGQRVRVPVNHGLEAGQRPHHLHGLAFDQPSQAQAVTNSRGSYVQAEFAPGFHGSSWTGKTSLSMKHSLENGTYRFSMKATNVGDTPVPMGGGAHPYFVAPSGDPSAVKLVIPGRELVEIDNYTNVLPTGRILKVEDNPEFNFNNPEGVPLNGRYLDNLWINLEKDANGYAFAEFIDTKAKLRVRLTATTKNIIGIQVFAPRPQDNPKLGVFAAIEFVTNLPDPRESLWKDTPTGMTLLQPGESFHYGYKIETLPL